MRLKHYNRMRSSQNLLGRTHARVFFIFHRYSHLSVYLLRCARGMFFVLRQLVCLHSRQYRTQNTFRCRWTTPFKAAKPPAPVWRTRTPRDPLDRSPVYARDDRVGEDRPTETGTVYSFIEWAVYATSLYYNVICVVRRARR